MTRQGELESIRVARALRAEILHGKRLPGSRLVERDIAADLAVSRLPVREAIRALVAEGVVVTKPRSCARVREFTATDVRELGEAREAIETLVFVLAAERHDEAGLAELESALDEEFAGAASGDQARAGDAGGEFHRVVARLSGNEMLTELLEGMGTRLRLLFGWDDSLREGAEQHRVLFEAIARRDTVLLRELVPRHLDIGRQAALQRLESSGAVVR